MVLLLKKVIVYACTPLRGKSNGLAAGKIKMQRELLHIIWCGSFLFVRSAYP